MQNSVYAPQRIPGTEILQQFRETVLTVFTKCKEAHENKSKLMFGHGDLAKNGIEIGVQSQNTLRLRTMTKDLETYSDSDARITILSSTCFSGGWSVIPDLRPNASTIMAAAKDTCRSCNYSYSFRRGSGSMLATAVLDKLTSLEDGQTLHDAAQEEESPPEAQFELQEESYREFCSMVFEILLKGRQYLQSYRGFDDTGDDGSLHNLIRRIISGQEIDEVEPAWAAIQYRMEQMSTADYYLTYLQIPPPDDLQCCDFDTTDLITKMGE
ncbi:MAG: hypothetical protein LQ350_007800, partial [Teloschistes chrysophthalmus]